MDLNFEIFMIALLVLSILAVGNFLRDGESNWLEGALLVVSPRLDCPGWSRKEHGVANGTQVVYVVVAIASWYYPNPDVATSNGLGDIMSKNVTLDLEVLQRIQQLLQQQLQQ